MTKAIMRKKVGKIFKNLDSIQYKPSVKELIFVVLTLVSVFAKFSEIPLAFLPLIYIQLAKNEKLRVITCSICVISFSLITVQSAYYIPYIAFTFVYMLGLSLLKNSGIPIAYFALGVFILTKLYMLSYGYDSLYWIIFLVECPAIILLPSILSDAIESLTIPKDYKASTDLFSIVVLFLFLSLSGIGFKIFGVSVSVIILLSLAITYSEKSNQTLSLISIVTLFFCLSQSKNFAYMFVGFLAIYIACVYVKKSSVISYFALSFFSFSISILFLTKFNSFIFFISTSISLLGYYLINKFELIKEKAEKVNENTVGGKDYNILMAKLEKLNKSFSFLGNTVVDISNILTKESIPEELESMVANEVCKNCKKASHCWQEEYSSTQGQFCKYSNAIQSEGAAVFDDWFLASCPVSGKLYEAFEKSKRLLITKQLMSSAAKQSQKMLQNQFLTLSQTIQDITYESRKSGNVNTAFTHTIHHYLSMMNIRISYCLCFQNRNKLIILTKEEITPPQCMKIKMKLESLYHNKFDMPKVEKEENSICYTFLEIPLFSFEFHCESKGQTLVCGDSCETLQTDEYLYLLLSDGMGTGSFAAAESKTAISMLKSLLTASVRVKNAIDIVNITLNLKGTGQSCASIDILQLDLYNGECQLIKAGAAPSLIVSANQVNVLYKDSLPVGILKDTNISQSSFILNNGDMAILLSDGIDLKNNYMQRLKLLGNQYSSKDISRYMMENCATIDDATVAAIKLVRI